MLPHTRTFRKETVKPRVDGLHLTLLVVMLAASAGTGAENTLNKRSKRQKTKQLQVKTNLK